MARDYYEIDPSNPPDFKEIVRRWADNAVKAVKPDGEYHLYLPVDLLYNAREVDRAKYEMRAMEDHEWERLKKSLSKKKWLPDKPAILTIGQDGCVYLAGGNHRATLAKKVGLKMAPTKLIFNQKACDHENALQIYSPPENLKEAHGSYKQKNMMFTDPAGGHFQEDDIKLGGHPQFHDRSRQAVRANRPNPINKGLFEDEDDRLDQASYLYQNTNLTFKELIKILEKACNGELKAIERPEGYTFFLSFQNDEVRFARNKTEMKNGGLTLEKIKNKKWKGKRFLKDCREVLFDLERAIYSIDSQLKNRIFQDGSVFYKATLVNDDRTDIIQYDEDYLIIQKIGHYKVEDKEVQRVNTRASKKYSQYLDKLLDSIQEEYSDRKAQIKRTAVHDLEMREDKGCLRKTAQKLVETLRRYNLDHSDTIGDFISARIEHMIKASDHDLPNNLVKLGAQIIIGHADVDDIPKDISPENKKKLKNLLSDSSKRKKFLRISIQPIQDIIRNFTSKILKSIQSAFVLNNDSNKMVRDRLERAIEAIQNYDGEESDKYQDKLKKHLESIDNLDDLSLPLKDLAFVHDGTLYKFSGNYNPVKNILKMYQDEFSFSEKLQENKNYFRKQDKRVHGLSDRSIAVIPGAFKPPHMGHFELLDHMVNMREANGERVVEEAIILISPKTRVGHSHDNRIVVNAEMSMGIWKVFTQGMPRVQIKISEYNSPLRSTFSFMEEKMDEGDTLWVAQGDKDEDSSAVSKLQDYSDARNLGIQVEVETTDLYGKGVSSSQMRHYLANGNKDAFAGFMPDHLTKQEREYCYEAIKEGQPSHSILQEMKIPLIKELDGGYSGHAAQMGPIRNEPQRSVEVDPPTPHEKPHTAGNDEIEEKEENSGNRHVNYIKSLKRKIQDLEGQAKATDDNDKIESLNKEIGDLRNSLDDALDKLLTYYINNYSEIEIDEISGMGAGTVAGTPNPGHGGNAQNAEAIRQQRGNK